MYSECICNFCARRSVVVRRFDHEKLQGITVFVLMFTATPCLATFYCANRWLLDVSY